MPLSPNEINNILHLSKALRDWSIDPKLKKEGPDSFYEGSILSCLVYRKGDDTSGGSQSGYDKAKQNFCDEVLEHLCVLDPIIANKFKIKFDELIHRAKQVDEKSISPNFVKDYAAQIAQELEDIAEGLGPQLNGKSGKEKIQFPKHRMALTIIPSQFKVSTRTLYRKIKDGTLKPYPDEKGKIFLDTVAVAERYKRLK